MKYIFEKCNIKYKEEYHNTVLILYANIEKENFLNFLLTLPSEIQGLVSIKSIEYRFKIINKEFIVGNELVKFAIINNQYDLLVLYLEILVPRENVSDIIDEYKYLLREDINIFYLYMSSKAQLLDNADFLSKLQEYIGKYDESGIIDLLKYEKGLSIELNALVKKAKKSTQQILISHTIDILLNNSMFGSAVELLNTNQSNNYSEKFLLAQIYYNQKEFPKATNIVTNALNDGYECYKLYELYASIQYDQGYQLMALENYEISYSLNNTNINILNNILSIRCNNDKVVEDDLLTTASKSGEYYTQFMVAISYEKLCNRHMYGRHIKKSMLLSGVNEMQILVFFSIIF